MRREHVAFARSNGLSLRKSCVLARTARSGLRYRSRQAPKDSKLISDLRRVAQAYPKAGYRMAAARLPYKLSFGRAYRAWVKAGLSLPQRKSRRKLRGTGHRGMSAARPQGIWAYDFVHETLPNGQKLKCLTIVDEYTRECLALRVARSIRSFDVIDELAKLFALRGPPAWIRSDNGPEFVAHALVDWLKINNVGTSFIEPGKPWQNGIVESFHKTLRRELLNDEYFATRSEAKVVMDAWRTDYNQNRPHSSLGYVPPAKRRSWWMNNLNPLVTGNRIQKLSV